LRREEDWLRLVFRSDCFDSCFKVNFSLVQSFPGIAMGLLWLHLKIFLNVLGMHVDRIEFYLDIALVHFRKGLIEGVFFLHSADVSDLVENFSGIFEEICDEV